MYFIKLTVLSYAYTSLHLNFFSQCQKKKHHKNNMRTFDLYLQIKQKNVNFYFFQQNVVVDFKTI